MPKNLKLLLTENVDNLGIVGDVVTVRLGFARNFLLPRNMATEPSEAALQAVAERRAEAQRQLAELRRQREELVHRLDGTELTMQRSCNDQGILYASVTQQDIAHALEEAGYPGIKPRDVRLSQNIKRVDTYEVHVKFESDLEAHVKLWVLADRKLDTSRREETPEGDEAQQAETPAHGEEAAAPAETAPRAERTRERPERAEKPEKAEKTDKKPKAKGDKKADRPAEAEKKGAGWGTPVTRPDFDLGTPRRGRGRR
jgi:large subunit ribosomal protein L9